MVTLGGEVMDYAHMLGETPLRYQLNCDNAAPAFIAPATQAAMAVAAGQADVCMAFRVMMQQPSSTNADLIAYLMQKATPNTADAEFTQPFGSFSPTQWAGIHMNRYLHESDATEEHFSIFASIQREYAGRNPDALQRTPLTPEDYLASPFISAPLRMLDCDYPCDSVGAVVFATEERARDLRHRPVFVEAAALVGSRAMSFELQPDMANSPVFCAETLWSRTDLRPGDVDCAQLYDGFSFITFEWLESLGFCDPGQAGPFIAEGNTRLDGRLPLNTDGGAANVGRRHGTNFCIEATRQLRGGNGDRQVPDAEVAVWTNAVGPFGGAMLLTAG
jgi:acetyl-CoA acetyltransferase